jgi:hypothetical protein
MAAGLAVAAIPVIAQTSWRVDIAKNTLFARQLQSRIGVNRL